MQSPQGRREALTWLATEWNHAYLPDLFLDGQVQEGYRLCYVPDESQRVDGEFGLLLRNDVAEAQASAARCVDWPMDTGAVAG